MGRTTKNLAALLPNDPNEPSRADAQGTPTASTTPEGPQDTGETVPTRQGSTQPAIPDTPAPSSRQEPKYVRSTLDLHPDDHAMLKRWAVDAEASVGRTVRHQQVLRALVSRLLSDPDLAQAVTEDLRSQLAQTVSRRLRTH